jgi:hypothetical protein
MLFFLVFAATHPRRSPGFFPGLAPISCPPSPNSIPRHSSDLPFCPSPVFSYSYKLPLLPREKQLLCFHALTNCPIRNPFVLIFMHRMGGVGGPCSSEPPAPISYTLSPSFSYSCAPFCVCEKLNPLVFKRFRTLSRKHPGWGGTPISQPSEFGSVRGGKAGAGLPHRK